jgi:hypothetical protein
MGQSGCLPSNAGRTRNLILQTEATAKTAKTHRMRVFCTLWPVLAVLSVGVERDKFWFRRGLPVIVEDAGPRSRCSLSRFSPSWSRSGPPTDQRFLGHRSAAVPCCCCSVGRIKVIKRTRAAVVGLLRDRKCRPLRLCPPIRPPGQLNNRKPPPRPAPKPWQTPHILIHRVVLPPSCRPSLAPTQLCFSRPANRSNLANRSFASQMVCT